MSSHREAPQIAKDPVADSTDVYAFVSSYNPDMVALIANYIPLQLPDGGPNFYEFGDDVLYCINIDNTGDGKPDISYQWTFTTTNTIPSTFLYNVGPIESLDSPNWNRKQTYTLKRVDYTNGVATSTTTLGSDYPCPPCYVGPLSTPRWQNLGNAAIRTFNSGGHSGRVYAGQRADGFFVDLGAVFDLGDLRPFEQDHTKFGLKNTGLGKMAAGVNSVAGLNVHSLILEVPITDLTRGGTKPKSTTASNAVIGVWTTASRHASTVLTSGSGTPTETGGYVQVSRLGNPLVNEVLIPLSEKDTWNASQPSGDSTYVKDFSNPELAQLLPVLYPGVFPHLAAYNKGKPDRADLVAILLTGIPAGIIAKDYTTQINGSSTEADMLRLNVAIPPTPRSKANNLGALGGDIGGYPNGRRVFDDVATIELRAVAGATLPLVDKSYKPDKAAGLVSFGLTKGGKDLYLGGMEHYQMGFPFLAHPNNAFNVEDLRLA